MQNKGDADSRMQTRIKNTPLPTILFGDNFEATKEPNCSFWGWTFGHDQDQNAQE
jgi:hypothetical protein